MLLYQAGPGAHVLNFQVLFGCHWCFWLLLLFVLVRGPWWGCTLLWRPDHRPPYVYRLHLRPLGQVDWGLDVLWVLGGLWSK